MTSPCSATRTAPLMYPYLSYRDTSSSIRAALLEGGVSVAQQSFAARITKAEIRWNLPSMTGQGMIRTGARSNRLESRSCPRRSFNPAGFGDSFRQGPEFIGARFHKLRMAPDGSVGVGKVEYRFACVLRHRHQAPIVSYCCKTMIDHSFR